MVTALATDFAALDETQVVILRDIRRALPPLPRMHVRNVSDVDQYRAAFDQETARADWTLVIAPEPGGHLVERVERVNRCGGRLLGPGTAIARLASDKHATAKHLAKAGVPIPEGARLSPDGSVPAVLTGPVVIKPCDGAGSQGVRRLDWPRPADEWPHDPRKWRIEKFYPGRAASVAFLCGPGGLVPLAPCAQMLSDDGHFRYLGGRLPLAPALAERARDIARRAVATLPEPLGYLGVDLVLGADPSGRDDVVIEINPRLTTSYIGLRVATRDNAGGCRRSHTRAIVCARGGGIHRRRDHRSRLFPRRAIVSSTTRPGRHSAYARAGRRRGSCSFLRYGGCVIFCCFSLPSE
jgi:tyramine---L-glutamate ligase